MLTESQKITIRTVVNTSLDQAENHWNRGGYTLSLESMTLDEATVINRESSKLPGHPIVQDGETVIAEFIALVADMRDSTDHLLHEISARRAKVTRLERVYYETSSLLPAIAQTVKFEKGNITEYLGDGVLGFFKVDPSDRHKSIYAAHDAAKNIVGDTRDIVNNILNDRYSLPHLDLGVGLAISKTLITLVGLNKEKHPKAFGECVYRASKLSTGKNIVIADKGLHSMWPATENGRLRFKPVRVKGIDAFQVG